MAKRQPHLILMAAAALLSSCVGPAGSSSSEGDSTPPTTEIPSSSSEESSSEESSSEKSSSEESSESEEGTVESIAIDALPAIKVAETLDLTPYVHFLDGSGKEVSVPPLLEISVTQSSSSEDSGLIAPLEGLSIVGSYPGTVTLSVSLLMAGTALASASAPLTVETGSTEVAELLPELEVGGNYTLKTVDAEGEETYSAYRDEAYYCDSLGEGAAILQDGLLYDLKLDAQGALTVLPGGKENAAEELSELLPEIAIIEEDVIYDEPFYAASGLEAEYGIYGYDAIDAIMTAAGIGSYVETSTDILLAYELPILQASEGSISLAAIYLSYLTYELYLLPYTVEISAIGTTEVKAIEDYIASGEIPVFEGNEVTDRILEAANGMNYTIEATGNLVEVGTDNPIDKADLIEQETMGDFYQATYETRYMYFTEDGMWVDDYYYDDWTGTVTHEEYGYMNHVDGYVCTFDYSSGKAEIGTKDTDWVTGAPVEAPFYDTYHKNLSSITEQTIVGARMSIDAEDPSIIHYSYADDEGGLVAGVDDSFGALLLDLTHEDLTTLALDDSIGAPLIESLTMDLWLTEANGVGYKARLTLPIDGQTSYDYIVEGEIKDIGTTVINGLSDILDDEPEYDWGGGWEW